MTVSKLDEEISTPEDEGFVNRWSRRKRTARENQAALQETDSQSPAVEIPAEPTDADMPPLESLTENSDYTGFLSPGVSEVLRKQALRKLFSSPSFNFRDGLDDYDGIYTEFEKLGDIITADMRHQLEMESRRQLQQLAEQQSMQDDEKVATVTSAEVTEIHDEVLASADADTEQELAQLDDEEVEL